MKYITGVVLDVSRLLGEDGVTVTIQDRTTGIPEKIWYPDGGKNVVDPPRFSGVDIAVPVASHQLTGDYTGYWQVMAMPRTDGDGNRR